MNLIKKLWRSTTFTTWAALSSKYLSFLIILPLILNRFNKEEIAIWYLFSSVIAFSGFFDIGFSQTLIRYSSYISKGFNNLSFFLVPEVAKDRTNLKIDWDLMGDFFGTFKTIYFAISGLIIIVLGGGGFFLIKKTIISSSDYLYYSLCWGVNVLGISIIFNGKKYDSILRGFNYVALINRWETLFNLLMGLSFIISLIILPKILILIILTHLWGIITFIRNREILKRKLSRINIKKKNVFDKKIFNICWSPSWKTGLMTAGTQSINHFANMILSNFVGIGNLASYLFSNRILQINNQISWAPFYSKIPVYNSLRADNKIIELRKMALKNINKSLFIFLLVALVIGILNKIFLNMLKSNVEFVKMELWILMLVAIFFDRLQAMHAQIYMTKNRIPFYITTFLSGTIYLILLLLLIGKFYEYSIPISLILANLLVNVWYNLAKSLHSLNISFYNYFVKYLYQPLLLMFFIVLILYYYEKIL